MNFDTENINAGHLICSDLLMPVKRLTQKFVSLQEGLGHLCGKYMHENEF